MKNILSSISWRAHSRLVGFLSHTFDWIHQWNHLDLKFWGEKNLNNKFNIFLQYMRLFLFSISSVLILFICIFHTIFPFWVCCKIHYSKVVHNIPLPFLMIKKIPYLFWILVIFLFWNLTVTLFFKERTLIYWFSLSIFFVLLIAAFNVIFFFALIFGFKLPEFYLSFTS